MIQTMHILDQLDSERIVLKIDVDTWNYKQQHLNHYVHHKPHKRKLPHNPKNIIN